MQGSWRIQLQWPGCCRRRMVRMVVTEQIQRLPAVEGMTIRPGDEVIAVSGSPMQAPQRMSVRAMRWFLHWSRKDSLHWAIKSASDIDTRFNRKINLHSSKDGFDEPCFEIDANGVVMAMYGGRLSRYVTRSPGGGGPKLWLITAYGS